MSRWCRPWSCCRPRGLRLAMLGVLVGVVQNDEETMKFDNNNRGFRFASFTDRTDKQCSIQKSSLAFEDCIWLGIDDANPKIFLLGVGWRPLELPDLPEGDAYLFDTRMHLTQEQVAELIPVLKHFRRYWRASMSNSLVVCGVVRKIHHRDTPCQAMNRSFVSQELVTCKFCIKKLDPVPRPPLPPEVEDAIKACRCGELLAM